MQTLFEKGDDLLLELKLPLEEVGAFLSGCVIEELQAQIAPHLPGHRGDVEAGGLGEFLGMVDAVAALARGLDWHVKGGKGQPGRNAEGRVDAVARDDAQNGIGPPPSSLNPGFGDIPLGASQIEAGVEIESDQSESRKIPFRRGPGGWSRAAKFLDELTEARVVEGARFKSGCTLGRIEREALKALAPGQESRNDQETTQRQRMSHYKRE